MDSGGGGGWVFGSQNIKSVKYDMQRIFLILTRMCVGDNVFVFMGKYCMTSQFDTVSSYGIHGQKSPLLPPGKNIFADYDISPTCITLTLPINSLCLHGYPSWININKTSHIFPECLKIRLF